MFDSIHLTLLIGPLAVPAPAPLPLVEALQSVQVNSDRERTGFQLKFSVGKTSLIQLALLPAGFFDPMTTRVVVIVTFRGLPQVICDGVVTRQEVSPSNEAGQSTLTLTGEDLSVLMGLEQKRQPHSATTHSAQVNLILGQYAIWGIVPVVVPPIADTVQSPTQGTEQQTVTDYNYIKSLASESGYTFYIEPGPAPLTSIAYFGPDVRIPIPQPALSVNMDWATNVDSLSFSLDGLSKSTTVITVLDPIEYKTPIQIPLPSLDVFKPPLGTRVLPPARLRYSENMTQLSPDRALQRAFGLMREGADTIHGNGSLSVPRYGSILRSRLLVGVRGAGLAYDGLYYVESVTHNLKRGEYKQNFTLARDGLISQTPVVPALP